MQKIGADTGLAKEYKNVFELAGIPSFQQFYMFGIFIWKYLWKGFYKAWHVIPCPTIANPKAERMMFRMNTPKAITSEMAGQIGRAHV